MSPERDSERLLRQWLDEGPTRAADRLLETVEERIDQQRQRPVWRLTWRGIFMNRTFGAFAAGAAVVAIALVGFNLASGARAPDSVAAAPDASGAAPVAPPSATPPGPSPAAPGSSDAPSNGELAWTFNGTLPEGWGQDGNEFGLGEDVFIDVNQNQSVMATDCVMGPAAGVGTAAQDLARALSSRSGLAVSGLHASDGVGGLGGLQLDLKVTDKWTGSCPWWENGETPVVPAIGYFDEKNYWHYNAVVPEERVRLWLLDVPGKGNVIIAFWTPNQEAFDANIAGAESILDGIEFDTGS